MAYVSRRQLLRGVASTAVGLVFLNAACAPAAPAQTGQAKQPAATAKPGAAAPAAPKAATRVRMSHAGVGTFRLPVYVAIQNGYFAQEGVDLEVVETRSGSDAMKMLAGKAVEFSTGQLVDAVNLNKEGVAIQGVAMLTNRLGNSITVRKAVANEIKSMADLRGPNRTVGVTSVGSGTWQFAVYAAHLAGVKRDEINFVPVGTGAAVIGAVQAGRIDAMSYADPENLQLVENGDAVFLIDMNDEANHKQLIGETYLNNQVMVSGDYVKEKPELVQGFVNAIQRGTVWASSSTPEATARLILGFPGFSGSDEALLVKSLNRMWKSVPKSVVITRDAFDNAMKLPVTIGVVEQPMPFEVLANNTFAEKATAQYPASG